MTILSLPPSEIRYTQDSIGTTFGRSTRHAFQPIGETLDDLLKGRCSINTIPSISVTWKNGKVYSADNRRLWVFKKAEELGSCNSIPVREIDDYYISSMKWTTVNDGESFLPSSEIRFTQDSIGTTFGRSTRHAFQPIGETLDDLLKGRCSIYSIPSISVTWKKGKVYSVDSRRLWICKKAEELGSFNSIPSRFKVKMTILSLPSSEIRFTQDSIGTTFGRSTRHAFQPIGETLDDLLKGRCSIYSIPSISVTWKKGKVYSADSRRLWICKKAEELGSFNSIPVRENDDYYISP
ncbi:hypothetical protein KUTeg_004052 [Tegillarca granosa]|uniref:Uncharacterized protein n=1 Tax=Tegillarca granosa TaxID=220873 RepID=A0ABQ9FQH2_TEGGR|nr:hypothetical protein KUTeg_004052 [Tegillarca granosa]